MKPIPFTQNGINELKIELEERKLKRPAIIKELQRARELGDLSENGLYKATKGQLIDTDRRIRHINYLLKNAKVEESIGQDTVGIGNTIILELDGKQVKYQLVGTYESNPSEGKISIESPLGILILGKAIGETVVLNRGKELKYRILKIS